MSLDEYGIKFGTDKASACAENPPHDYCRQYENLFGSLVARDISLLEIGVLRGASLKMWRAFFGSQADIAGIDDDPTLFQAHAELSAAGFRIYHGNQNNLAFLLDVAKSAGPWDIIIDDGGHYSDAQITSFSFLWKYVRPGGWYVVEDLATSFNKHFSPKQSAVDFFLALASSMLSGIGRDFDKVHISSQLFAIRKSCA